MRSISRRLALQGLGLAVAAPLSRAWAAADEPSLTFLAVGDWGRDGDFHQADVAARMGETAGQIGARFIVSVGDNFYEDGVTGVDDPKWKTSFEDVYKAPALQAPWYAALGNHDYHGDSQAQLDYAAKSSRWNMPHRWYSFVKSTGTGAGAMSLEIFMLDTSPLISDYYADGAKKVKVAGQDTGAQLAWLDSALAASKADWKIVIGHHPVYSGGGQDASHGEGGSSPDLVAKLDPILQRHRVPLYVNGHDHDLQHVFHGATHYVCTGAGSKTRSQCLTDGSDFCSVESGFTAFAVTPKLLRVGYRDYLGAELHVVDIAQPV
jgi:tartrate-resistant acid phosphatase type 5